MHYDAIVLRCDASQAPLLIQEYVKPLHDIRYAVEWHREDRIARVSEVILALSEHVLF